MLVAVLLLFLLAEFPSGILTLLSGILDENFFHNVYAPLGEIIDMIALINSSINFVLYCSMSSVFRETFLLLFCATCSRERDTNQSSLVTETQMATFRTTPVTVTVTGDANDVTHL